MPLTDARAIELRVVVQTSIGLEISQRPSLPQPRQRSYGWILGARRLKWEKYHENVAESAESDSDSEEVDIAESESDEEDPLANIL